MTNNFQLILIGKGLFLSEKEGVIQSRGNDWSCHIECQTLNLVQLGLIVEHEIIQAQVLEIARFRIVRDTSQLLTRETEQVVCLSECLKK